jgi:hypothetical protein
VVSGRRYQGEEIRLQRVVARASRARAVKRVWGTTEIGERTSECDVSVMRCVTQQRRGALDVMIPNLNASTTGTDEKQCCNVDRLPIDGQDRRLLTILLRLIGHVEL